MENIELSTKWLREIINSLMDKTKTVDEKVINNKMKKVYDESDIVDWVSFGIEKGYIDFEDDDIIKWIGLLKGRNIDL